MVELGEFAKHYGEFKALNTRILPVSVDPMSRARQVRSELKLPFPILSDRHGTAMRRYGTRSLSKYRSRYGPYDAATLVLVDRTGTIRWIYQNANYRIRSSVQNDLQQIRKLE
ncbi:MAG: redoxin domain-containing protein [Terriglobia bacterium]